MAIVLFGWFAIGAGVIVYIVDSSPAWREFQERVSGRQSKQHDAALRLGDGQRSGTAIGQGAGQRDGQSGGQGSGQANGRTGRLNNTYAASILIPERGSLCTQYGFDNRSGAMWDEGLVDCDESRLDHILKDRAKGAGDERLRAIRKSLGHGG
ncbi:MAG: hypothetical protein AB7O50_01630 [Pseudolabrys sp.]